MRESPDFMKHTAVQSPAMSYYDLRVTQSNTLPDGSPIMAWSSPVWVTLDS